MSADVKPLDEETITRLRQLSTSVVADTKHASVHVLTPTVEPAHVEDTVVGPARTVELDPEAIWPPIQTLDTAREGDIIVVDVDDCVHEAVWGELLSTYAVTTGVEGMVTNGAIRDIGGIRDVGFSVFAQARTPRGPSGSEETARNRPIRIGETQIESGDVVMGDETGVVVIERNCVGDVITAAESVAEKEHRVEQQITEGELLGEAFGEMG